MDADVVVAQLCQAYDDGRAFSAHPKPLYFFCRGDATKDGVTEP